MPLYTKTKPMKNEYNQLPTLNTEFVEQLSTEELYCLRLLLHNRSAVSIAKFLDKDVKEVYMIKSRILKKINRKTWYDTIIVAFKTNILNPYDFVNPIIKKKGIDHSEYLMYQVTQTSIEANSVNYFKKAVLSFYRDCEETLIKENKEHFSQSEKRYLEFKFQGYSTSAIQIQLMLNNTQFAKVESDLNKKLKQREWFNRFKKVFQFQLISKETSFSFMLDTEAIETASKIVSMLTFRKVSQKEKQLAMYHQLVAFYTTVELNFLKCGKL